MTNMIKKSWPGKPFPGTKYVILTAFFLSMALSSHAHQKENENSLLWEISGNNLAKPSYLFGTYHFAGKDFIDTMTVLNARLNAADAIVGELIIDSTVAVKLLPFMQMKNNTLDKLLGPEAYQAVAVYLKTVSGYDLKLFNTMKPMAIQLTLMQFTMPKTFSASNPPIDQYIQDYGKAKHKAVIGLETAEEQAALLFGNSLERQKELLVKSVANQEKNKRQSQQQYNDYIRQNLKNIAKAFRHRGDYTRAEWDALLKDRNNKWLARLRGLMQNRSLFIAVGAGHLVGKDGLIKGLQRLGYKVRPLS